MSELPVNLVDNTLMIPFGNTQNNLVRVKGRILTIIDSAVPQGPQNKATKDLVRMAFDELYRDLLQAVPLVNGQSLDMKAALEGDDK
jgi:hypothetical protein